MNTWFKFGCYTSATAFVLDVYLHELGMAILMALTFYVCYRSIEDERV